MRATRSIATALLPTVLAVVRVAVPAHADSYDSASERFAAGHAGTRHEPVAAQHARQRILSFLNRNLADQ